MNALTTNHTLLTLKMDNNFIPESSFSFRSLLFFILFFFLLSTTTTTTTSSSSSSFSLSSPFFFFFFFFSSSSSSSHSLTLSSLQNAVLSSSSPSVPIKHSFPSASQEHFYHVRHNQICLISVEGIDSRRRKKGLRG